MQEIENKSEENVLVRDDVSEKTENFSIAAIKFITLLVAAVFAPAIGIQALTGTIVNAALFVSASTLGIGAAILVGIIPSIVSFATGMLPAVLAPMVPFIIISNAILIAVFAAFKGKSFAQMVIIASVLKFAFLSAASMVVIKYLIPAKLASQVALMMSWPQLFTALSGGILAYFVLGMLRKIEK